MDQYADEMRIKRQMEAEMCSKTAGVSPIRRGNAPLADRLHDRLYRAQQTEAQGRQEAADLQTALTLLRSQPGISEILDAIAKVGII